MSTAKARPHKTSYKRFLWGSQGVRDHRERSFWSCREVFQQPVKRLEQVPLVYTEIIPGVRRTLLPRFPYGVFYTVKNDLVHVLAVIHNARNPLRWPSERAR